MSKFCYHCGSELANKDARFCSGCGKPQQAEGSEAIQITTVRNPAESKQPSNDTEPEQNALKTESIGDRLATLRLLEQMEDILKNHPGVKHIQTAIELDKTIRYSKENDIEIDSKDQIMRNQLMTDLKYSVDGWWKSSGYTCNVHNTSHYVFTEIYQALHAVFRSYREEHDSEVTEQMIRIGDKSDQFTYILVAICCIGIIFFAVAIWSSAEEEAKVTQNALWITLGVVAFVFCNVGCYTISVQSKVAEHKREFQKGLFSALEKRVTEINELEAVSPYIYVLFFDEWEWESYVNNNEIKGKAVVNNNSEPKIVGRIFVFSLECNSLKSFHKIPKGTIYSNKQN